MGRYEKSKAMKKLLTLLFVLVALGSMAKAQSVAWSVTEFKMMPTDLDARVNYPVRDPNGKLCALIKIETSYSGFTFSTGTLEVMKTEKKPGEWWVYVQKGVRKITIGHERGILREWLFPEPIHESTVYVMKLSDGSLPPTPPTGDFAMDHIVNNRNCVYGCGEGSSREEADELAMQAFLQALKVHCEAEVPVEAGDINIYVSRVAGSKKRNADAKYVVYRYVDKKEYIDNHLLECGEYMHLADTYEFEGRGINLKLGAYYYAYQAIDTKLMDVLYEDNALQKKIIKKKMQDVYSRVIGINRYGDESRVCVWAMGDPPLYSFEYKLDGKWKKPTILSEKLTNVLNNSNTFYGKYEKVRKYVSCYIPRMERRDPPMRIMFDKIVGDEIVQIDVPEEWYMIGWICG